MKIYKVVYLGLLASFGAPAVTLDVGLVDNDRPPYFLRPSATSPASGMYIDILNEIGRQTGIDFRYRFLPQNRIRTYMKIGLLDVEPGIDPNWRTKEGEAESSVYTETLFYSQEVLIYNPSKFPTPPTPEELMLHASCKVLGFNGVKNDKIDSHALLSEERIIDLIKLQRCDWAIFPIDVINSQSSFDRLKYTEPVATYALSIRLNKDSAEHLVNMNKAIKEMKDSGKLTAIINSYIED